MRHASRNRLGVSLVEMLVTLAITLMMMAAVVSVFALISDSVSATRSTTEMSDRLRAAADRLQADLDGATVTAMPTIRPDAGLGYLEYVEGPQVDSRLPTEPENIAGDLDDVLMLTVRSRGAPFAGKPEFLAGPELIESDVAEVVYFVRNNTLYRQVRTVLPSAEFVPNARRPQSFSRDISFRLDDQGRVVYNSLGDLTKRENRFAHLRTEFPYPLSTGQLLPYDAYTPADDRAGQDVLLTNVIGFDIKVFDATAPIRQTREGAVVQPGDPAYATAQNLDLAGAFVDLNYARADGLSHFSGPGDPRSRLTNTYDTWSFHYEHNGINEDQDQLVDEGTNGIDDDNRAGVDDPGERETAPPYDVPLRGMQIRLRVWEPDSRQVREVTVVGEFLPD